MSQQIAFPRRMLWMAAVMVVFTYGCDRPPVKTASQDEKVVKQQTAAKVKVGIVREQTLRETIDLPATLESDETAMLMARVEAYVGKVLVDIGDEVEEGQVLIQLEAPEYVHQMTEQQAMIRQLEADEQVLLAEVEASRTQLEVVRAQLELKNSERDRISRLVSTGAIERQRLEEAESSAKSVSATLLKYQNAVQVAEAKLLKGKSEMAVALSKLQAAKTIVGYLEIKAPFAGVVVKRQVDPGNLVRPANQASGSGPLLVIDKVDKLQAIMHATTDVAGQLTVGDKVTYISDDAADRPIVANLSRTAGSYDELTRMMRAEVDLDNTPDPATGVRPLRSGGYGSAIIVLQEETLPVVPKSAVIRANDKASVVVIRNETCQFVPIEIAIESDGLVGIRSGVENGEQVVVGQPGAIQTGQKLTREQVVLVP